jgi:PAS domain S-box-containing protein
MAAHQPQVEEGTPMGSSLQAEMLDDALLWASIAVLPNALFSGLFWLHEGGSPVAGVNLAMPVLGWTLWSLRRHVSARVKLCCMLSVIWVAGSIGLLASGPQFVSGIHLLVFGCLAFLFMRRTPAFALNVINALTVATVGTLASTGRLHFDAALLEFSHAPLAWATMVWTLMSYAWVLTSISLRMIVKVKKGEDELKDMLDYIRMITANIPGVIYQFRRAPDGRVSFPFIHDNLSTYFGLEPEAVMRDADVALEHVHPDDRKMLIDTVRLHPGEPPADPYGAFRVRHPVKGEIWVKRLSTARRLADGSVLWTGVLFDVTRTRILQQQLSATLDTASDIAVQWYDRRGCIVFWNPASEQIFGLAAREVSGRQPSELRLMIGRIETWPVIVREVFELGHTFGPFEIEIIRPDGGVRIASATYFQIPGNTAPLVACMMVDITERKRAEAELIESRQQAESQSRAKTEFLTRMSHELRTPLNAIIGFAQVMDMEVLGPLLPAQKEALSHLLHGGRHLTEVLGEILDLAQIETGRISLDPQSLHVATVVGEVLALFERSLQEKGMLIRHHGDPDVYVRADVTRFRQVLFNLVSNAIKYNRRNGAVVITWQSKWDRVRLAVSDTGNGIPLGRYDEVFQPFSRFDAEAKNIDGAGIGLVICKRLVEAMQGAIGFESAEGCGSDFWIELPRVDMPRTDVSLPDAAQPACPSVENWAGLQGTVIYVENGRINQQVMAHIFYLLPGVRLLTAPDGRSGLRLMRETGPDLVLLDIDLPDMTGGCLLNEMRACPELVGIPVLAVSASVMPTDVAAGLQAGFDRYISKPIDVKAFLNTLAVFLRGA